MKPELQIWNKPIFGNIHNHVKEATSLLEGVQANINDHGASEELISQERKTKFDLEKALSTEEIYWNENARIKWNSYGDSNTRFFHMYANLKHAFRKIGSLRINEDLETHLEKHVSHLINHFSNMFSKSNLVTDNGLIDEVFP